MKYEENIDLIQNKNLELQNIRAHKLSRSLIRSRVKWIEYGEKPYSYFCHLESKSYTSKIIPRIIDENDEEIADQKEIISEVERFYRCLYSKNDNEVADLDLSSEMADFKFNTLVNNDKNSLMAKLHIRRLKKHSKIWLATRVLGVTVFPLSFYPRATRCGGDIVTLLWFRASVRAWFRPSVGRPCEHDRD